MNKILILFSVFSLAFGCTKYIVTASALNVRDGPGTGYKSVKTINLNTEVCVESFTGDWAKLDSGKYVSKTYLKLKPVTVTPTPTPTPTPSPTSRELYRVTTSLNIRSGPSATSTKVGSYTAGTMVCVVSLDKGWAKLSTGNYVSSDYLTHYGKLENKCPGGGSASCLSITQSQMLVLFPRLTESEARSYAGHLESTFKESSINTKFRICHFLGQIGHESGGLKWFEEKADGSKYEGREKLGNTQPGDGVKFKGRGVIQVTGRYNYDLCGKYLKLDLLSKPELLVQPTYAFRSAGWFWTYRKLNTYADADNIREITIKVNGATDGLEARTTWYKNAKAVYEF